MDINELILHLMANMPVEWEAGEGSAESILIDYVHTLERRVVELGGSLMPDGHDD